MVVVPGLIPVTIPVVAPTDAMAGLLLLHIPPGSASLSVVVEPAHRLALPVMGEVPGMAFTVIVVITPVPQPNELMTV